jgi:hypothetical protein
MIVNIGCEYIADQRSTDDAPSVKILKEAGAIVLVKGNIP